MNEDLEPQSWLADQSVGAAMPPEPEDRDDPDAEFWEEASQVCDRLTYVEPHHIEIPRLIPDSAVSCRLLLTPARVEDIILVRGVSLLETECYDIFKDAKGKTISSKYRRSEFRGEFEDLIAQETCVDGLLRNLAQRPVTAILIGADAKFDIGRLVVTGWGCGVTTAHKSMLKNVQFLCTKCDKVTDDRTGETESTADVGQRPH
jgi:hypothetical protein